MHCERGDRKGRYHEAEVYAEWMREKNTVIHSVAFFDELISVLVLFYIFGFVGT